MAKIKDLFKQVEEKKIILPNFQREFVWERDQQKNLLASLFTSITIGSVLFLEGKKGVFTAREIGHKKNIDDQSDLKDDLIYLLDGQQRFTCIKSFFSDLFEDKSTESYNKFFPKIRNRWFLHLSENSDNFLGYHNLIFNKEKYRISTPTDIKDDIICKMDICRATSKSFYDISEELKEKKTDLIGNRWIPIQLMYGEMEVVEQILISIGESRKIELEYELTDDEKIELLTPVEKNIKELFKTHEKEKDDKKKTEVYIKIQQAWMKVYNKWASDVKSFLESIMSADIPSINITEEQLPKASAIFEHINKGGTPLSTFDLFCAKFHNLDLRESLKTTLNNSIETPKDLLNENFSEWKPINFGVLTQNEGSFSKSFQDQFLNTLSLLSHIKKHGVDKITVAHIKRDTILELIEDDVKDFIVPAINGLIRTYCFLQMRCGLRKIENISYELLILPLTVILSNDTYWKKQSAAKRIKVFNSLEYFYWISIFSGRYSKDQNERSISDIKRIFNWVENSLDVSEEIGLNSDQFKLLLNLDDFATEKILKNEDKLNHTPKSIKENILNFILSKKPSDLDLEGEGYDSLKSWEIANGDYNSEVHHIIPLTQGKETIKQSTKEIRTDKSHYLNSILNLTIIREESNRYIGGLKPSEYLSEIVVQNGTLSLTEHCISFNQQHFTGKKKASKDFISSRYSNILSRIQTHLQSLWRSI